MKGKHLHNVNGPNVSMTIMGIKCDNPDCDFADMSVKVEDYPLWLNKPCPKCGANLLTQADYEKVQQLLEVGNWLNKVSLPEEVQQPRVRMHVNFEGTGKLIVTEVAAVDDNAE